MEMSFFGMEHGDVFFCGMPLAQTWLARTQNITLQMPYSLRTRKVILNVAPGQALYILYVCPENRDESKGNSIVKLWLQFIPSTVLYNNQIRVARVPRFTGQAEDAG